MFDRLSDKLQGVLKDLRGQGRISEGNVTEALREVRLALLEADVHYQVAKDFIGRVREQALGEKVLRSVTPGQQMVKFFHDELTMLLGGDTSPLNLQSSTRILMVGLNGAGKTTTSAKLAHWLKKQGKRSGLVACDLVRPAAIEQLGVLGEQIDVPVFRPGVGERDVLKSSRRALEWVEEHQLPIAIFDTAGRQEIDEALIEEIKRLKDLIQPHEILLVCDAATGQQAVSVAENFHNALGLTGIVLTKLEGDARGGAALSLREVTKQPIKFAGIGEKVDQFEPFHPDRVAGRILGMGDVVGLVEKAAEAIDEQDTLRLEKKLRMAQFDLGDFLDQFKMLRKMGPIENLLGMIPGLNNIKDSSIDEKQLKRIEAIILSMTPQERAKPDVLNARRRQRVTRGSGTSVTEVNSLLLRFNQMKKMMKKTGKMKKLMTQLRSNAFAGLN